ncbi:MAG: hypothetical protein SFU85_12595 [Candidatus Methylacidiphilales bacterium]|nr:hypothetical protein [Candidatus Methylacidiphilales bacterium]
MKSRPSHIPGHANKKMAFCILGLSLFLIGLWDLMPVFRLICFGTTGTVEAVRVVKSRPGSRDILINDSVVLKREETTDRSWTFWNDFNLITDTGEEVQVRLPVGSQLQSLYPLRDEDGLPSALLVRYNRFNPQDIAFLTVLGTWFVPGVFLAAGLIGLCSGAVLFRYASKEVDTN